MWFLLNIITVVIDYMFSYAKRGYSLHVISPGVIFQTHFTSGDVLVTYVLKGFTPRGLTFFIILRFTCFSVVKSAYISL